MTEFYLFLAVGGALGGLFNGIVAPLLFHRVTEYPLALVAAAFARPWQRTDAPKGQLGFDVGAGVLLALVTAGFVWGATLLHVAEASMVFAIVFLLPAAANYSQLGAPRRFAFGLVGILIGATVYAGPHGRTIRAIRNFYGVVRVTRDDQGKFTKIVHGDTVHGAEFTAVAERDIPLTYYGRSGPLGDLMRMMDGKSAALDVAIIGLGAGASATYARPTDHFTFYELNPAVITIAQAGGDFFFLADAFPADRGLQIIVGDARLRLHDVAPASYDLLVVDAFNSDAIPNHLLTREALDLYFDKVRAGGIVAFHVSNRFLDLRPVLADGARALGMHLLLRTGAPSADGMVYAARWAALARDATTLAPLVSGGWAPVDTPPLRRPWTDDYSSATPLFVAESLVDR